MDITKSSEKLTKLSFHETFEVCQADCYHAMAARRVYFVCAASF